VEVLAASFAKSPLKVYSVYYSFLGIKFQFSWKKEFQKKSSQCVVVFSEAKKFNSHEIPGISFRQTGNWTPEDEISRINCPNLAPEQRNVSPRNEKFYPIKTDVFHRSRPP